MTLNDGLALVEDGQVMVEKSTLQVDAMPNDPPDMMTTVLYKGNNCHHNAVQIDTHQKLK